MIAKLSLIAAGMNLLLLGLFIALGDPLGIYLGFISGGICLQYGWKKLGVREDA